MRMDGFLVLRVHSRNWEKTTLETIFMRKVFLRVYQGSPHGDGREATGPGASSSGGHNG